MNSIVKDLPSEKSTPEERSSGYWRWVHGFDNIDSQPQGWPIIKVKK